MFSFPFILDVVVPQRCYNLIACKYQSQGLLWDLFNSKASSLSLNWQCFFSNRNRQLKLDKNVSWYIFLNSLLSTASKFPFDLHFLFFVFLGRTHGIWKFYEEAKGRNGGCEPLAYAATTAMPHLCRICDLRYSSWQCWILKPLSKARDRTLILMDTTLVCYHWAMTGTPWYMYISQ